VYEHIAERLKEGWSLEAISARIGDGFTGYSISVSTLYRVIKRDRADLKPYLPERGKPRRTRVAHRRSKFQTKQGATPKRSIEARPESVLLRDEAGHFEGDTIVGRKKGSKEAILSLCERRYRLRYYVKVENLEATTVRRAMMRLLHSMPEQLRQTITLDNGGEFAEWEQIEKVFPGMKVYFCHPYAWQEKGSVERSNRDFRYFAPKGTDFSSMSDEKVAEINHRINNRPMKCLGWKTPRECYLESLH
jgi:IS30 family transposase